MSPKRYVHMWFRSNDHMILRIKSYRGIQNIKRVLVVEDELELS